MNLLTSKQSIATVFFTAVLAGLMLEGILDFLNQYSTGITALAALSASGFASVGLSAWKKQLKGKTDYEIARNYLKQALYLRDAISSVRNPFISIDEIEKSLVTQGYTDTIEKNKDRAVYQTRWQKVQTVWTDFEAIVIEAEVSWGKGAIEIQKGIDSHTRKLRSVIWLYITYPETFHKNWEENHALLYNTGDEDDFAKKIDSEISKIRDFLTPYLE